MRTLIFFISIILSGGSILGQDLPKQIKVGKERSKARQEIRLPHIDGYQTLKCDFHMHTIFSDGIVWPSLRVQEAWEEGLDAIATTDHIEGQPIREGLKKGNHNQSYESAKETALRRDIILIKGAEITRSMPPGHLNALFVKDVNKLDQTDVMKAIEEACKQGAFIQWNHPGWGVDEIKWHDMHEELYQKGCLHGIEVYNEFEWYPMALNWVIEKDLTLLGNTDVHDVTERLYDFKNHDHRPMTLVFAKERSEEGIKEALFAKRTVVYFYNTLMGKKEYLNQFFKKAIKISPVFYTSDNKKYVTVTNQYDVPFLLIKKSETTNGLPNEIEIPANRSIVLSYTDKDIEGMQTTYVVKNLIISPTEFLEITLF